MSNNPAIKNSLKNSFGIAKHWSTLLLVAFVLTACGEEKYETKFTPEIPPNVLYEEASVKVKQQAFEVAGKKFSDIVTQYPYSPWARKSLLMATYAYYSAKKYDESVSSGTKYIDSYPTAKDIDYAIYLVGLSYFERVPDVSHDQENALKALEYLDKVVSQHPDSAYFADSKNKRQLMRDQLAGKEMSVGRFYLIRKNYMAAMNRFREVLAKYQSTRHVEEALARIVEAALGLGLVHEAETAAAVLGHNYPNSQWYQDTYRLMQQQGLRPQEDRGSWISQAFQKKSE